MKKLLIFVLAVVSLGAAQTSATGALTVAAATCTGNGPTCANLVLNDPYTGAVGIDISGTFVGTGQLEGSFDGKALDDATKTWRSISVTPVASTTTVTSFTAGGAWRVAVSGMTDVRVRCSAYTSGTIVVALRSARQAASIGGATAVYASGNGTNNVIPKGNGAGALADSSVTDAGTILASTDLALSLTEGACSGAAANKDLLCADSTGHTFKGSFNNGSFFVLPSWVTGGATTNTIAKTSGTTGQLADSSLTDTGSVLTTTDTVVVPVSAAAATPTISVVGAPTFGVYFNTTLMGLLGGANGWVSVGNTAATTLQIPATGVLGWSSSGTFGGAGNDTFIGRDAARVVRIGSVAAASPSADTLQVGESSRAATDSNVAGSAGSIRPGTGTGLGAGTKLCLQRNLMGVTGSAAQSQIDGICVGPSKTLSNTTATATSLANISVPSNSAGGVFGTITVTCTDGTNFDSETQSFNTSYVNKATVLTVTAPVITATSAANNSGSCTAGITAVAGTNSVDIKVTPAFTTIVPTIVTSYIELHVHGTGNVTFN